MRKLCAILGILALTADSVSAFKIPVHRRLSEITIPYSELDTYLTERMGAEDSSSLTLRGMSAKEWIAQGSELEDGSEVAHLRFCTHFHDPSDDWEIAGLRARKCPKGGVPVGRQPSSVAWAQSPGNEFSWAALRRAFYLWLTYSDAGIRDNWGAFLFQGLGHQIHLVQDAAVPAHVRRDPHPALDDFENWTAYILETDPWDFDALAHTLIPTADLDPLFDGSPADSQFQPVAMLIDSIRPGATVIPSAGIDVGMAEFTHGNFPTEDTMAAYPFPRPESLGDPVRIGTRTYLPKVADGVEVPIFLESGNLTEQALHRATTLKDLGGELDNLLVMRSHMSVLLPRAVTYSAAVIDHFFRGRIDLEASGQERYEVRNLSSEELSGQFEVYYDDHWGRRHRLWSDVPRKPLPPDGTFTARFPLPEDAARPGELLLVFTGVMGREGDPEATLANGLPLAVAAAKVNVPSGPGAHAGIDHRVEGKEVHTHQGATAYDPDGNLVYYGWSWLECGAAECPPLSGNVAGSLPGGVQQVDVPGPTFELPGYSGSFTLLLEVQDLEGNAASSAVMHTATGFAVCGEDLSGELIRVAEPFVSGGSDHSSPVGTHEHHITVRSEHDAPFYFFFDWWISCCDENWLGCECDPPIETNREDFRYQDSTRHAIRLDPGELTSIPIRAVFREPGDYAINYSHTLCGAGGSRHFWPQEEVRAEE